MGRPSPGLGFPSRSSWPEQSGLSSVASIVSIAIGLVIVLALTLLGTGGFSGSGSGSGPSPSIVSSSSSEQQLQLCVEGRPSVYGNPPTPAQQAACTRQLAGQLGGGGAPAGAAQVPSPTTLPDLGAPAG